jgi:hypothetical protein
LSGETAISPIRGLFARLSIGARTFVDVTRRGSAVRLVNRDAVFDGSLIFVFASRDEASGGERED